MSPAKLVLHASGSRAQGPMQVTWEHLKKAPGLAAPETSSTRIFSGGAQERPRAPGQLSLRTRASAPVRVTVLFCLQFGGGTGLTRKIKHFRQTPKPGHRRRCTRTPPRCSQRSGRRRPGLRAHESLEDRRGHRGIFYSVRSQGAWETPPAPPAPTTGPLRSLLRGVSSPCTPERSDDTLGGTFLMLREFRD